MLIPKAPLSRRSFLRGCLAGATIGVALPPLEAMLGFGRAAAQGLDDRFFGLFYWANGTPWHAGHGPEQAGRPDLWTPPDVGAEYRPSELLAPLARHRVTAITGLEPHTAVPALPPGQSDGHMRGFMVAMTGDRILPEGFDHGSHSLTALRPTLDQFVARHPQWYASPPPFRSLEAGVSEARFHDYGHWNGISYNGPYSINLPIMRPRLLFDRLFVQQSERAEIDRRLVVLDAVQADARRLRAKLGARDRARLDAHLDHVRDLQRRLDAELPACAVPAAPADGGDLITKTRVMGELLALAVDCRLTRVFSLMLTAPATTHVFGNLGVPDGMHKTCHDGLWEHVRAITRHQMEAFAVFLDAFRARVRPDGTSLLDAGLVYGTTEYGEGWLHSVKELPVLIAGRAGGAFVDAMHVRAPGDNLSRAQLTALSALGLDVPTFGWNGGETRDVLPGLLA
ncbi:MAG: DUF1552 domain-containing protein [Myxococcales bacterium]|nr:DUF1552 domain-containing protein [Myxococcales bacterium]